MDDDMMIDMALEEEEECLETQIDPPPIRVPERQPEEEVEEDALAPPSPDLLEEEEQLLRDTDLPLVELYEQIKQQVLSKYQHMDKVGCLLELQKMHNKWGQRSTTNHILTFQELHEMALRNFGVPDESDLVQGTEYVVKDILLRVKRVEWEIAFLFLVLRKQNLLVTPEDGQGLLTSDEEDALGFAQEEFTLRLDPSILCKAVTDIRDTIYSLRKMMGLMVTLSIQKSQPIYSYTIEDKDIDKEFNKFCQKLGVLGGEEEEKGIHILLNYLLDCAAEKFLAKIEEEQTINVYVPVFEHGRINMHAYELYSDIDKWRNEMVSGDYDYNMWKLYHSNSGYEKQTLKELKSCESSRLPWLVRNRTLFSFSNGLYDAENMVFHRFNRGTGALEGDTSTLKGVAAKHFRGVNFDPYEEILDWRDIETPMLQHILDYQGITGEIGDWMYILLGRMLYDIGTHDKWQCCLYLKGFGATGKSTICSMICNMYEQKSVGNLGNSSERKFGISPLLGKYVFKASEIKQDMQIDQADLQQMISGEDVVVNIKNQTAQFIKWKAPGIFAGNEPPQWRDNSGSIQRRVVMFNFDKPVQQGQNIGNLDDLLEQELPDILVKINRAYREAAQEYGQRGDLHSYLPEYFKQTSRDLISSIQPLEAFLNSDEVIIEEGAVVAMPEFKERMQEYFMMNGMGRQRLTKEFISAPLTRRNLHITRNEQGQEIIEGIRMRDSVTNNGYDVL
jgi:hypothetical protein